MHGGASEVDEDRATGCRGRRGSVVVVAVWTGLARELKLRRVQRIDLVDYAGKACWRVHDHVCGRGAHKEKSR